MAQAAKAATPSSQPLDPALLERAQAWRDAAEALTVAQVELDERAAERWMPRVAAIEQARRDPATPPQLHRELVATLAALERVGLLAH